MQRIIMTAAVLLLGGLAVTAAKADQNYGPVTDKAKNLCYSRSPSSEMGFGFWSECPKPATATTTTTVHHRHAKHS